MGKTYRIVIPGAVFLDEMRSMRTRLASCLAAGDAVPFQLFFDHFDLTAENKVLKSKLLRRGSFAPIAGQYKNSGPPLSHTLRNIGPTLDEVELYIPRNLHVGYDVDGAERLQFEFFADKPLLELSRVPPELGIGRRFNFARLQWDDAGALYFFVQEDDATNVLELFVDVTQRQLAFMAEGGQLRLRSRLRVALAQTFAGGGCCSGFEVIENDAPPGPLSLVLHAKILVPPAISIADQVAAANATFAAADVSLTLGSVEHLNLPSLVDLDVGRCMRGEYSDEQATLFSYRSGAAARDVCAYWVGSLNGGGGSLLGCAAHPPSTWAFALRAGAGSQYVLAHELGHVLGLNHVRDGCLQNAPELMNPCDSYSNPPPDLSPQEISTLRNVAWRNGILHQR